MNRAQRKARLKAIKQRIKEARRAETQGETPLPVAEVSTQLEQAREMMEQAAGLSEAEARQMLADAARLVHQVVRTTDAALQQVPEAWRNEAAQIVMARPEASDVPAQKRPRRGADPVVTLMRVGLQASSLLTRIINKLHPGLGRLKRAA
jgi:hypothetical protein